jgi:hypothetical protein
MRSELTPEQQTKITIVETGIHGMYEAAAKDFLLHPGGEYWHNLEEAMHAVQMWSESRRFSPGMKSAIALVDELWGMPIGKWMAYLHSANKNRGA